MKVQTAGDTKSADVTFEKPAAARTAQLLNLTRLGPNVIKVYELEGLAEAEDGRPLETAGDSDHISQEEKPRARILAEYLAHGYLVADSGLKTAIALDEKHGVSHSFVATLQRLDARLHATDRARTADQSYGITQRASNLLTGLHSYFEKASNTPTGKRIVDFYTQSQRQVVDIHNEAKRLSGLKREEAGGSSYKAAGLDRFFGAEKTKPAPAEPLAPAHAAAVESDQPPTAPSTVPGNNETATQIPK